MAQSWAVRTESSAVQRTDPYCTLHGLNQIWNLCSFLSAVFEAGSLSTEVYLGRWSGWWSVDLHYFSLSTATCFSFLNCLLPCVERKSAPWRLGPCPVYLCVRCLQGWFLSGGSQGECIFLPFPALRGCSHSLVCGPSSHLSDFLPLSYKDPVITSDNSRQSPYLEILILTTSAKILLDIWGNIHRFQNKDMDFFGVPLLNLPQSVFPPSTLAQ